MAPDTDSQLERNLKRRARRRRSFRRVIMRTVAYLIVILMFSAFYVSIIGVPKTIERRILAEVNKGDLYLEVQKLTVDPFEGLVAVSPRLFRKKVIGAPFMQAEELVLQLNPGNVLIKENMLTGVRIYKGKFLPDTGPRPDNPTYMKEVLEGTFLLEKCDVEGTWFDSLECRYKVEGPKLTINNMNARVGKNGSGGVVRGSFVRHDKDNTLEGHITGEFNPSEFHKTMLTRNLAGLSKVVSRFDFKGNTPKLSADFVMNWGEKRSFKLTGEGLVNSCAYNQVPITRSEFNIAMLLTEDYRSTMTISPLIIEREDGRIDASLEQNFSKSNMSFNVSSSVSPHALLGLIDPDYPRRFSNLHSRGKTEVDGHGLIYYHAPDRSRLQLKVKSEGLGLGRLTSEVCSFDLIRKGETMTMKDMRGTLYDGDFEGDVVFQPSEIQDVIRYKLVGKADGVRFKKLAAALGESHKDYHGLLHGRATMTGLLNNHPADSLTGSGNIRLTGSQAFKLPIIGDLSRMIAGMIPGLDFLHNDTEIKSDYFIADKKIAMPNFSVEGNVITLKASGIYDFDRHVDFRVKTKLMKDHTLVGEGLNLIFLPVSSLLEFQLTNTLDEPYWSPLVLPNSLKKRIKPQKPQDGESHYLGPDDIVDATPKRVSDTEEAARQALEKWKDWKVNP